MKIQETISAPIRTDKEQQQRQSGNLLAHFPSQITGLDWPGRREGGIELNYTKYMSYSEQ